MPTLYGPRKTTRASWSQDSLNQAIKTIREEKTPVRSAARKFNIPESTLRGILLKGRSEKPKLGKGPLLGHNAEEKLVEHVKKLQAAGFPVTRTELRVIAYDLAKTLEIANSAFNNGTKMTGRDWLKSFLTRHPGLSVRKPEGLSLARAVGMNRDEVGQYFELLTKLLTDYDLLKKPGRIYNMDESGLQLNNEPTEVIAAKGSKDVHAVKATERGETVTVVGCCNAEGTFLPPYCIFKGLKKQKVWEERMPPGSAITMRKESAYMSADLFMDWMVNHFIPRKPQGQCLLILDGHSSHVNSSKMLQAAVENDIILLCLPSHSTHYLQPLDRAFFKPLKAYYRSAANEWVRAHPGQRIERRHFGELLGSAWSNAATTEIARSGFSATGIFPLCPSAIPDHAYVIDQHSPKPLDVSLTIQIPESSNTYNQTRESFSSPSPLTPNEALSKISPIPTIKFEGPPKRKQSAANLTDPDFITFRAVKEMKKEEEISRKNGKDRKLCQASAKRVKPKTKGKNFAEENQCVECLELYEGTSSPDDWIRCVKCKKWFHESCSIHEDRCNRCGSQPAKKSSKRS